MTNPPQSFFVYRYQLLPLSQESLFTTSGQRMSLDELKAKKNAIFASVLTSGLELRYNKAQLVYRVEHISEDVYVLRLAVRRDVVFSPEPFNEQQVTNWPSLDILINNNPSSQKIAIMDDPEVFQNSGTAAGILEKNLNLELQLHGLSIYIEPTFSKNDFWAMVEEYRNRITMIKFELISPNMANISKALTVDLKALNKTTNTHKTSIQLQSSGKSNLTIPTDNPDVEGLVNYASEGGGKISVKVRGIRKTLTTDRSITEVTLEELDITGHSPRETAEVIKSVLS